MWMGNTPETGGFRGWLIGQRHLGQASCRVGCLELRFLFSADPDQNNENGRDPVAKQLPIHTRAPRVAHADGQLSAGSAPPASRPLCARARSCTVARRGPARHRLASRSARMAYGETKLVRDFRAFFLSLPPLPFDYRGGVAYDGEFFLQEQTEYAWGTLPCPSTLACQYFD